MANSKKPSANNKRSGRGKKTNASPPQDDAKKRKKTGEPSPKPETAAKPRKQRMRKVPKAPEPFQPPTIEAITTPQIILAPQEPVQIVGPSLPFNIDDPRLHGLDPAVLDQWYSENLKLHEYPDPNSIEVDDDGYVVGYVTKPDDRGYSIRESDSHIIVPDAVLTGLFKVNLPDLLKRGDAPSRSVLKLLTGLSTLR